MKSSNFPPIPELAKSVSYNKVKEHLDVIDSDACSFDFRTIYKNGRTTKYRGSLADIHDILYKENLNGAGIYVTVNETDGQGIKKENIVKVRSLFLDFDGQKKGILGVINNMPLKPTAIVSTSEGNYHVYFRVTDCPLNKFKEIQSQLIEKYGADKSVNDLSRAMRIAGFNNTKNEPYYPCRIIETREVKYSIREIISSFEIGGGVENRTDKTDTNTSIVGSVSRQKSAIPNISSSNRADWIASIINGNDLHDSTMKLLSSNIGRFQMTKQEALKDVQELLKKSTVFGTDRFRQRFNDLSRLADDAENLLNPFNSDIYDWPEIIPIEPTLKAVEALNLDHLPSLFKKYVQDVSERMQCPPDYAAIGLFVSIASVVGRKVRIYPKQKDDWLVVPNLWGVVIGRPSLMKTASLKGALDILKSFEIEEREIFEEALIDYEIDKDFKKWKKSEVERQTKELLSSGNKERARELLKEFKSENDKPTRSRLTINDSTVEKTGELLNENPNGFLVFRDELTGWLNSLDKEGSNDRPFYLEAWEGSGNYTYDRIERGTIEIESTTISLLGGIQPSKIKSYVYAALKSTSSDDGLIQRLQLAVYPDVNKTYKHIDRHPDQLAKKALINKFTEIKNWQPVSTVQNSFGGDEPFAFRYSAEAQQCFNDWFIKNEETCRSGIHPALESHFAKYRSLLPSLALIIELADAPNVTLIQHVSLASLQKAIGYVEYLRSHAYRIYGMAEKPEIEGANLIINRIKKLKSPFTAREVQRKGWTGLTSIDVVNKSLELLEEHNYCRKMTSKALKGGRDSVCYYLNPFIIQ